MFIDREQSYRCSHVGVMWLSSNIGACLSTQKNILLYCGQTHRFRSSCLALAKSAQVVKLESCHSDNSLSQTKGNSRIGIHVQQCIYGNAVVLNKNTSWCGQEPCRTALAVGGHLRFQDTVFTCVDVAPKCKTHPNFPGIKIPSKTMVISRIFGHRILGATNTTRVDTVLVFSR